MGEKKYNFSDFKLRISPRTPTTTHSYYRYGYRGAEPASRDFSLDEIYQIIREGDLNEQRALSRYYYRTKGEYRNNIDFLAHLPLYDTMVIPIYQEGKGSKSQIMKAFYNACDFVDELDIPNTFAYITTEWLVSGIYNGILRKDGDKYILQDLPIQYCRTRFKDFNNLNILEFNLYYFEHISDAELRAEALTTFPEVVQKAYKQWKAGTRKSEWVELPAASGGVCFGFMNDLTPLLLASIPELKQLDDAIKREEKRDENELYKLLIQKMPVDSKGELVFELEEVADIHASVAKMLENTETVDVLTTFGDTSLESLQETSAASQSADRIDKYKKNAWDALGRGEILFNPEGSASLAYEIKKDEALMIAYLNVYESWVKFHLNDMFARKDVSFDFKILPTTVFNRSDVQASYFRGAQYGYSKMFAGVAMGIKQMDQLSLMNFENDFLQMSSKMVPLQSSYTTSGSDIRSEEKNNNSSAQNASNNSSSNDITNTGGRPELPDEQKSEKTQANIAAAG